MLQNKYEIDLAENSEQALDKVKQKRYDAILMDINLGEGIIGTELTRIIRKLPGYESITIIAVTAYASEEDKEKFLSKGMSHYIAKPFSQKELLKLLDSVFTENQNR